MIKFEKIYMLLNTIASSVFLITFSCCSDNIQSANMYDANKQKDCLEKSCEIYDNKVFGDSLFESVYSKEEANIALASIVVNLCMKINQMYHTNPDLNFLHPSVLQNLADTVAVYDTLDKLVDIMPNVAEKADEDISVLDGFAQVYGILFIVSPKFFDNYTNEHLSITFSLSAKMAALGGPPLLSTECRDIVISINHRMIKDINSSREDLHTIYNKAHDSKEHYIKDLETFVKAKCESEELEATLRSIAEFEKKCIKKT